MLYKRHRSPTEIISYAVFLYHRFGLNLRDIGEILAYRGIGVSYEAIRKWGGKFGPLYAH
ncbi:IS6 family transposase [Candidatus Paracaedibacter symbiosus]|uniref:IS6 family transposase n=1 Tax=Candidatus Paracaedibacter symbiosus TaxID=244582 RepID=UPI000689E8E7|nr:IS6 family transposase [Candidatus Paracaedibacter symbiosus]